MTLTKIEQDTDLKTIVLHYSVDDTPAAVVTINIHEDKIIVKYACTPSFGSSVALVESHTSTNLSQALITMIMVLSLESPLPSVVQLKLRGLITAENTEEVTAVFESYSAMMKVYLPRMRSNAAALLAMVSDMSAMEDWINQCT